MKFLGLDVSSSSTGWNVVEADKDSKKLVDYGLISPVGNMGVTQRLYFFGNELKKLIDKHQPDEIAIEETILVRGPKIMRTLARFGGVAIFLAYSYQKREVSLYEPSMWKKSLGIKGNAKKPEIQLKICEVFSLTDKQKIDTYLDELHRIEEADKAASGNEGFKKEEADIKQAEKTLKKHKSEFKRKKKKEITEQDSKDLEIEENALNERKLKFKESKKAFRDIEREIDKRYEKMSMDIYSDCGINPDIADSIGITLKLVNETFKAL